MNGSKMRKLIFIYIFIVFTSCDNVNDAAKLYRLGRRIERVSVNDESLNEYKESKKQNDWGVSTIMKIDTLKNDSAKYSVDLRLPVDTLKSIYMTMSVLPHMIKGYSENESDFILNFYQDSLIVIKYLVHYKKTSKNQYDYRLIKKYDSPTICISNAE